MSDFSQFIHHRKHEKFAAEADDVELRAVELGEYSFDGVHLDEVATGQFIEDQSASESLAHLPAPNVESTEDGIRRKLRDNLEDIQRGQLRREDSIAGVSAEIERRKTVLKDAYPFHAKRGSLRFKDTVNASESVYVSLLKLSAGGHVPNRDSFEGVVAKALQAYLGSERAKVLCFGWKAETEDNQPRRIKEMVNYLKEHSGEWSWSPDVGFPDNPSSQMVKDLGLDVIAWLPMPDGRMGQIFLVTQCATGATDWETKFDDVSWPKLENWIRPLPREWGTRCFAVPFHVPNTAKWQDVSKRAGLFLDRARITLLLQE